MVHPLIILLVLTYYWFLNPITPLLIIDYYYWLHAYLHALPACPYDWLLLMPNQARREQGDRRDEWQWRQTDRSIINKIKMTHGDKQTRRDWTWWTGQCGRISLDRREAGFGSMAWQTGSSASQTVAWGHGLIPSPSCHPLSPCPPHPHLVTRFGSDRCCYSLLLF